ncbi:MAG: FxsA family protein [Myxococcales bacterium]
MGLLFLAFTLIPFVELWLLIRIGKVIGAAPTLGFVVAMGLLGAYLAKQQGRRVVDEWRIAFAEGRVPEEGVLGGLLILVGGLFLITPGVITDFFGLFMLLPFTRKHLATALRTYLERQVASGGIQVQRFGFGVPHGGLHGSMPFGGHVRAPSASRREGRPVQTTTEVGRGPGRHANVIVETEGEEIERDDDRG